MSSWPRQKSTGEGEGVIREAARQASYFPPLCAVTVKDVEEQRVDSAGDEQARTVYKATQRSGVKQDGVTWRRGGPVAMCAHARPGLAHLALSCDAYAVTRPEQEEEGGAQDSRTGPSFANPLGPAGVLDTYLSALSSPRRGFLLSVCAAAGSGQGSWWSAVLRTEAALARTLVPEQVAGCLCPPETLQARPPITGLLVGNPRCTDGPAVQRKLP